MIQMGATEIAKSEIAMAKEYLTAEEFADLEKAISDIRIAGQTIQFHNERLLQ